MPAALTNLPCHWQELHAQNQQPASKSRFIILISCTRSRNGQKRVSEFHLATVNKAGLTKLDKSTLVVHGIKRDSKQAWNSWWTPKKERVLRVKSHQLHC